MVARAMTDRLRVKLRSAIDCLAVFASDSADDLSYTMLSLLDGASEDVLVLIISDGERGLPGADFLEVFRQRAVFDVEFLSLPENSSVALLNEMMSCTSCDWAVTFAAVQTPDRWLADMKAVTQRWTDAASVSCFSSEVGALSAPDENALVRSSPHGSDWLEYANRVRERSLALAPTIPLPSGCAWLIPRRSLNAVGELRDLASGGVVESVREFGSRAVELGLRNVLADSIYVGVRGTLRTAESPPHKVEGWTDDGSSRSSLMTRDRFGAFCLAKDRSRLHTDRLSVAVDCTDLTHFMNGTAVNSANVALALAARLEHVTAVVLPHAPEPVLRFFQEFGVAVDRVDEIRSDTSLRYDVVYRPTQFQSLDQLQWLKRIADRLVVNVLDLIAFHNPSYHSNFESFERYRGLQRLCFEVSDGLAFLSHFVASEASREYPRVARIPSRVVGIGLDSPPELRLALSRSRPRFRFRHGNELELGPLDIFMPGSGFKHKNRGFAIRLVAELQNLGWSGRLVLAGPYPECGSSEIADTTLLLGDAKAAERIIRCGHLDEERFRSALCGAGLLLFPSLVEGFGLPPFEAALSNTPAVTPDHGVFAEVVPQSARLLGDFNLAQSAREVLNAMSDDTLRQRLIEDLVAAAERRTWSDVAEQVTGLIEESLCQPRNPIRTIVAESTLISV